MSLWVFLFTEGDMRCNQSVTLIVMQELIVTEHEQSSADLRAVNHHEVNPDNNIIPVTGFFPRLIQISPLIDFIINELTLGVWVSRLDI